MKNFKIRKIENSASLNYSLLYSTVLPELATLDKKEIIALIAVQYLHNFKTNGLNSNMIGNAFNYKAESIKLGLEGLIEKNILLYEDNTLVYNYKYLYEKNRDVVVNMLQILNNTKGQIKVQIGEIKKEIVEAAQNKDFERVIELTKKLGDLENNIVESPKKSKKVKTSEGSTTITNNTKEIVEETQKEADLDVEKEIEHKDTTSTPEAEKPAKIEQKEVIKEDTSNDINKYKNICLELSNYKIPNYEKETSNNTEVDNNKDENKLEMEKSKTENLMKKLLELDNSDLNIKDKIEKINIKVKSWISENKKDYSDKYYLQVALNNYLQSEIDNIIENNKTYNNLPEATEEEKTEINGEYEIENAVDKYAKALEILHSKYVSDKVSKEDITKEFDEFFIYMDKTQANIIEVYRSLKHKFEKNMVKDIPTPTQKEQKEAVLDVKKETENKDTTSTPKAEKTPLNSVEKHKDEFARVREEALKTEKNNEEVTSFFDNII